MMLSRLLPNHRLLSRVESQSRPSVRPFPVSALVAMICHSPAEMKERDGDQRMGKASELRVRVGGVRARLATKHSRSLRAVRLEREIAQQGGQVNRDSLSLYGTLLESTYFNVSAVQR